LKEKSGKDYIKLSDKINCCETDLKKLQNILIENIEEIWDVNFIVFF